MSIIGYLLDRHKWRKPGLENGSNKIERLSGLADIIWQHSSPGPNDMIFIVSNSGRNIAIVEMALTAQKKEGFFTTAITALTQSKANTSLHASTQKRDQLAHHLSVRA